ncbi:MAG: phosphoribosyltransferase family protein [Synergistales bacterium]|nr:phosphoribosyltransferase family protein [Synergistales bacterium]
MTIVDYLLHFLWPVQCPLCGRPVSTVCPECLDILLQSSRSRCFSCHGEYPCPLHVGPPLLAGASHLDKARELLMLLKYKNSRSIGFSLGEALGRAFPAPESDFLVPLPLHRNSSRGYNQALLIARGLSRIWALPVLDGLSWSASWPNQTGRSATERQQLPREAFSWRGPPISEKRTVIVDDVSTTGTTLSRAARALEKEGGTVAAFVVWTVAEVKKR